MAKKSGAPDTLPTMKCMTNRYSLGFLFSEDQSHVCLIEKLKPDWQAGLLNGIGGKIESHEFPLDCMRREFKEETGLEVHDWRHFCTLKGKTWVVYCYTATGDPYEARTMEEEKVEVYWVEDVFLQLQNGVLPNLRWLIPLALDPDNLLAIVEDPS